MRSSLKQNVSYSALTLANPRGVARYLARLRKPARLHLELTAPGVSGGQVLPHNDRSRHTLARGRTGCDVRKNRDKEGKEDRKKRPVFLSRVSLIPKKRSRFRDFGERDCTRRDAVFLRDGEARQGRGRISASEGEGKVTHARGRIPPQILEKVDKGCAGVARTTVEKQ